MMHRGSHAVHHDALQRRARRGLTLIELMLAMTITVMVAGAMSGMMSAVSTGVLDRKDSRSNMIRSHAAESKLSAYVSPSRAIWEVSASSLTIWFNDQRSGGTIHANEIRWIFYDATKKTIEVHFIKLPDEWTQTAKDLYNVEFSKSMSSATVYAKYLAAGYMASLRLLDNVEGFSVSLNDSTALDADQVTFTLTFAGSDGPFVVSVPTTIAHHQAPVR